jgi:hypothetical protein
MSIVRHSWFSAFLEACIPVVCIACPRGCFDSFYAIRFLRAEFHLLYSFACGKVGLEIAGVENGTRPSMPCRYVMHVRGRCHELH